MRVYVVDQTLPGSGIVGRMEAEVGMITTLGNQIKTVHADACVIESRPSGSLSRKTDVCISLEEATNHGYGNGVRKPAQSGEKGGGKAKRRVAAKNSPEAGYSRNEPTPIDGTTAPKPSRKGGKR